MAITRNLDPVGRVVIPMEYRVQLGLIENDPLDISVENGAIVIRKQHLGCVFCGGSGNDLTYLNGKAVCRKCLDSLKQTT